MPRGARRASPSEGGAPEVADEAAANSLPAPPGVDVADPLPADPPPETPADSTNDADPAPAPVSMVEAYEQEVRRLTAAGNFEAAAAIERLTMFLAEMRAHVLANAHLREHSKMLDDAFRALH